MRFVHIADVHLGAEPDSGFPWSEQRGEEIWDSFRRLIRWISREKPELFLIAGDLFHRQPTRRQVAEVNYLFSQIKDTEIVMIAGNHDCIQANSWYTRFAWAENVHGLWNGRVEEVFLERLHTRVIGFSYHDKEISEPRYDGIRAENTEDFTVLLAHGGDGKHIPIRRESLQDSGFDYISLGHIHKPGVLIQDKAVYPGSLEPIDRTETGVHGFVTGSFEKGRVHTEFIPWARRSYIPLDVSCDRSMTQFELEENIQKIMSREGEQNMFLLRLSGIRDGDIRFHKERLLSLGNIVEITDDTRPDYDLEMMKRQYKGSLIEDLIHRLETYEEGSVEKKALYYGLEALIKTGGQEE